MLNKVDHVLDMVSFHVSRTFNFVAMAGVIAMVLYVVSDVVMRAVFNVARMGSVDAVSILMCFAFAWGVGWAQRQKGHIVIDILFEKFSRRSKEIIQSVVYFLCFLTISVVSWKAFVKAAQVKQSHIETYSKVEPFGPLPWWPFYDVVAVALVVLALVFLADFVHSLVARGRTK